MFQTLSNKLSSVFAKLRGKTTLSEADVELVLKEIRLALLEADVHFSVAKDVCARIKEKAVGESIEKYLSAEQKVVKLVHDELVKIMGGAYAPLSLQAAPPVVIMMVGLQGSGKTTTSGKLAKLIKKEDKKSVLLVPADVYRPAAIEQLQTLGKQIDIEVYQSDPTQNPRDIAKNAYNYAKNKLIDVVIIDTAGRLQIDEALIQELKDIKSLTNPHEILLVVDAMTGQESVNVAKGFDEAVSITGLVLTKLDGDARGGAALSIHETTKKPIKFIGISEKLDGIEIFHPDRLASRILGMGDVLSLIEKAAKQTNEEDIIKMQKKMQKNDMDLEDFLSQLQMMKNMGDMSSIMGMMPGMDKLAGKVDPEKMAKEMKRTESIILSMTPKERRNPDILNGQRKKRIAKGAGTTNEAINNLLKQFFDMKKMMSQLNKMFGGKMGGAMMKGLGKLAGGLPGGIGGGFGKGLPFKF